MKKSNILILLFFMLFFSGCSAFGETIRLNNYIFDNISTNYTTYSSFKINNLLSNLTGGNITINYNNYTINYNNTNFTNGYGLYINGSGFNVNTSQIQVRINDYCPTDYSIRRIYENGSVECEYDNGGGGGGTTNNYYSNVTINITIPVNESRIEYNNESKLKSFINYYINGDIINTTIYYNGSKMLYAIENKSGTIKLINLTYTNNSITRVVYN